MDNKKLQDFVEKITATISDLDLLLINLKGEIAASIATARIAKGLSQKELAEVLDVSQTLVSRWENGDSNYTLSTLAKLALALDIPINSPFDLEAMPRCDGNYQYATYTKKISSHNDNIIIFPGLAYSNGGRFEQKEWQIFSNTNELMEM